MFNLKKEKRKKDILLILSIITAFLFIVGLLCTILEEDSPIKFIINESPVKLIVPPILVFIFAFTFYRKSKKVIKENTK